MTPLGLIAGGGGLPLEIAAGCVAAGRPLYVLRLRGFADPALEAYVGESVGVAELGAAFAALKRAGCASVCMAGVVNRPDFAALKPDLRGMAALPGAIAAARRGDEALLRYLLDQFRREGFAIEGAHEVLTGLTLAAGPLGRHAPDAAAMADLSKALDIARTLGRLDVGQGAVVVDGVVLAVEAQEGTDAMLARVATLPDAVRGRPDALRGALAKAPKPQQERQIDLPVIGVRTIEGAAAAGLAGVAGEAGGVLLVEREAVLEAADRLGLFVYGAPAP